MKPGIGSFRFVAMLRKLRPEILLGGSGIRRACALSRVAVTAASSTRLSTLSAVTGTR